MVNVTYLFGAGASCEALPMVRDMKERIEKFLVEFSKEEYKLSIYESFDTKKSISAKSGVQEKFIENLILLKNECERHTSIDTYAKKLAIRNDKASLNNLKATLSLYLMFEQCINGYDKRYDTFYASVLNPGSFAFPPNIKIISWNYDYQFEKSFSEYFMSFRHDAIISQLNVISKFSRNNRTETNKFCICKLNGTANIIEDQSNFRQYEYTPSLKTEFNINIIEHALMNYEVALREGTDYRPGLSFAWEDDNSDNDNIISKTKAATYESVVLVVIGYSFPYFNRTIDRQIIKNMVKLNKVYFQSPQANSLIERFGSIMENFPKEKLIPIADTEQFYFPDEL